MTDEYGLFDAPCHGRDLTLIVTINWRVNLSLSRGEPHRGASRRACGRILFCDDEKLGCMVERDYTALTLIVMIDRRVDLSLSRGERAL